MLLTLFFLFLHVFVLTRSSESSIRHPAGHSQLHRLQCAMEDAPATREHHHWIQGRLNLLNPPFSSCREKWRPYASQAHRSFQDRRLTTEGGSGFSCWTYICFNGCFLCGSLVLSMQTAVVLLMRSHGVSISDELAGSLFQSDGGSFVSSLASQSQSAFSPLVFSSKKLASWPVQTRQLFRNETFQGPIYISIGAYIFHFLQFSILSMAMVLGRCWHTEV